MPISSRSSTSRKTDTEGSRCWMLRLITAHWSWPVDHTCERKVWYCLPASRVSFGSLVRVRVRVRLRVRLRGWVRVGVRVMVRDRDRARADLAPCAAQRGRVALL